MKRRVREVKKCLEGIATAGACITPYYNFIMKIKRKVFRCFAQVLGNFNFNIENFDFCIKK